MLRALVLVNLRPMERRTSWQPVRARVLDLPIGIENPVERPYAVRANMNSLRARSSRSSLDCSRRWA
jgi:hypothetical protein